MVLSYSGVIMSILKQFKSIQDVTNQHICDNTTFIFVCWKY